MDFDQDAEELDIDEAIGEEEEPEEDEENGYQEPI